MSPAEILAAAEPRTLRLPARGVDIAILDWGGDGPLALLHHANGFCKGVWGPVAEELRRDFRVVAMDARGHGDSSKPTGEGAYRWQEFIGDLVAVAETLVGEGSAPRVALGLGHSFGGTSFIGAAGQRPDLFERLLLLDPVVTPPASVARSPGYSEHLARMVEGAKRRRAVFPSREEAAAQWKARSFFARCDPRAVELYALDGLRRRDDGAFELKCPGAVEAAVFAQGPELDLFETAKGVETPTLILNAVYGNFPLAVHQAVAASMRQASVEPVETGHLVPLEKPELVAEFARRRPPETA
jgi:pimeloyl-ACP methyl ester carboxylesterase